MRRPAIILASASKRRSRILSECGIRHRIAISGLKEQIKKDGPPERLAMHNAKLKAELVAKRLKNGYVIGADTIVLVGGNLIGKPKDEAHARRILKEISAKTVLVYTGLCVKDVKRKRIAVGFEVSKVKVKSLKKEELDIYFRLLKPYDKAGGFSIEKAGSFIFDNIQGSYFNVLGLPMGKLKELFSKLGVELLEFIHKSKISK